MILSYGIPLRTPIEAMSNSSRASITSALTAPLALCLFFFIADGIRIVWVQSILEFTAGQMTRFSQMHSPSTFGATMDYAHRDLNILPNMSVSIISGQSQMGFQVRYTFTYWSPQFIRQIIPGAQKSSLAVLYSTF